MTPDPAAPLTSAGVAKCRSASSGRQARRVIARAFGSIHSRHLVYAARYADGHVGNPPRPLRCMALLPRSPLRQPSVSPLSPISGPNGNRYHPLPVAKRTVPAPLFAARAPIPQGASGLHVQTRGRIKVTGVAVEQGAVMSIHDSHVLTTSARVQTVGMGDEPNRWQRSGTLGTVQGSQHKPPRSQPVRAAFGRGDQALIWAAADTLGHPLGQGGEIRRGPSTVPLEPRVRATDRFRWAGHHGRAG